MFQIRPVTPAELPAVQTLRALVYGAEGLEDPQNFTPDGRYADDNDAHSINLGAFTSTGTLVGCLKVTPRTDDHPLKMESDVPAKTLGITPGERCVEMARLAVLSQYRMLGVALGLWQVAYWVTIQEGSEQIYAFQREGPLKTQEDIGLPVRRLNGRLEGQNGLLLTPTRIPVAEIIPSLAEKNPPMAYFFSRPLKGGVYEPRAALRPPAKEVKAFVAEFRSVPTAS